MLKKLAKTIFATTSILTGAALSTASPSQAVNSTVKLNSYTPSEITKVGVNSSGTAYEIKGLMDLAAEVRVVVDGGVHQVARRQSELVQELEHAPDADAQPVIAP